MAQTRRKRRTKHRGNAAGTIEVRGRTGRPPSPEERKKAQRERSRQTRMNRVPTWRASVNRALLAAGFMFLFILVTNHFRVLPAIIVALLSIVLYVPAGYYLDTFMYRRNQRKREAQQGK